MQEPLRRNGIPVFFGKGTKCMVIEAFDKSLFATIEDHIFSLEEIPDIQLKSENFDEILPFNSCFAAFFE